MNSKSRCGLTCRDMGANQSAVDVVVFAFCHRFRKSDGHTLPDTAGAPPPKTPIEFQLAVLLRHIAPGRAGTQPPQNAIDDVGVILGRPNPANACPTLVQPATAPSKYATRPPSDRRGSRLPPRICSLESKRESCVNGFCPRPLALQLD